MEMTYLVGPILAIGLLALILNRLLKKKLRERHAIWWAVGALFALGLSLFPVALSTLSEFLGFEAPLNFVLILAIVIIFLVNIQQSSELTQLEEKVRTLTEEIALMNMKHRNDSSDSGFRE